MDSHTYYYKASAARLIAMAKEDLKKKCGVEVEYKLKGIRQAGKFTIKAENSEKLEAAKKYIAGNRLYKSHFSEEESNAASK